MAAFLSVSTEPLRCGTRLVEGVLSEGHVRVIGTLQGLHRVSPLLSLRVSLLVFILESCSHSAASCSRS